MARRRRRTKYGNRKVTLYGITFDSKAEADRYLVLRDKEARGIIWGLRCQVRYTILDAFTHQYAGGVRPVTYIADFDYRLGDRFVVEDVKGVRTPVYRLKRKLFLLKYPEIDFREIEAYPKGRR